MKSNLLKFATCLIVAFGLMFANNLSAQSGSGGGKGNVTIPETRSGFKTKADCVQVIALAKRKGGELAYKVRIDYGQGKIQNETNTMKIEHNKTSGKECKCYSGSENITVTYAKNTNISKVNITESDKCN